MLYLQSAAMMFIAPGMSLAFGQVEAVAAVLVAMFWKVSKCSQPGKVNEGWLHIMTGNAGCQI